MNIDSVQNGIVIDHISAGKSMEIYSMLELSKLNCPVAIIMNVNSKKMGKKDIIKIDCDIDINLEVIGYVSPDSTVNIIKNEKLVNKYHISPPEKLVDIIKCTNSRCISTTERDIKHVFLLTNSGDRKYRCLYCEAESRKKLEN